MTRPDVPTDSRRAMTPSRKARIWEAWQGRCWFCRMPVDREGPGVVYDHVNPLWLAGSDADEDIGPIHSDPCNKVKTKADAKRIAKTKRQAKKLRLDVEREPSKRPIRSNPKIPSRPFQSRKFQQTRGMK